MKVYLILIYSIIILPLNILSLLNIGGYDSLLAFHQIYRSLEKSLIDEWVPHSSYLFPFVIKLFGLIFDSPRVIHNILFFSNSLVFALICLMVTREFSSSKKIQILSFSLSGIYFSNFMGVFYWDHLGFTLSLIILYSYLKKKYLIIALCLYSLFLLKLQIFAATSFALTIIIFIDFIKKQLEFKKILEIFFKTIFIFILFSILIYLTYGIDFFKEYFGYVHGRFVSIDPNTPFANKEIGSNYSFYKIVETIFFPLNMKFWDLSLNFSILNFTLQIFFYIAYIILFNKEVDQKNILFFLLISHIIFASYLGRGYLTIIIYLPLIFTFILEKKIKEKYHLIFSSLLVFIFIVLFFNEFYPLKKIINKNIEVIEPIYSSSKFKISRADQIHFDYVNSNNKEKVLPKIRSQLLFLKKQNYLSDNFFIFGHHLQLLFFLDGRDFKNKYPFTRIINENIFSKNFNNKKKYQDEQLEIIDNSEYIILHNYEYSKQDIDKIMNIYLKNFKFHKKFDDIYIYSKI